jgi:DNA polymerase-3 subunit delta
MSLLSETSLFGDQCVVVIRHTGKIPKKEIEKFVVAVEKNTDAMLLVGIEGGDGKDLEKYFSKEKGSAGVRFFAPSSSEAIALLGTIAHQKEVSIAPHVLSYLYEQQRCDIGLCVAEFDKLSLLKSEISTADIDALVFGLGAIDTEEFLTDILTKKNPLIQLEQVIDTMGGEIALVLRFQSFVKQLFYFHTYIKAHGTPDAIAILGYKPPSFVVDKKARLAMTIPIGSFSMILQTLLDIEYDLKFTKNEKEALLLNGLIKIQSNL